MSFHHSRKTKDRESVGTHAGKGAPWAILLASIASRLVLLLAILFPMSVFADNCSTTWRSPQKVWLNEYFFGAGGSAPPNFLEVYSTSNAFPASWQDMKIDVYSAHNTKTTYPLTNATAIACTVGNKTWLTTNVASGLRQQNGLVVLRDKDDKYVDAFVFDNTSPPAPWPGAVSLGWFPELADAEKGCPAIAKALEDQAADSDSKPKQANMLVLSNYGNKDMARDPDGGGRWDLTSNTGAGTTYTQCLTNNANFSKTVDNATPPPDSTVTFTLNLTNTSGSAMSGVTISDSMPPVLTYISATPSNPADPAVITGTYDAIDSNDGQTKTATMLTWSPASVAAGTTSKLYIKMQVPETAVVNHSYVNTAQTVSGLGSNQTDFANITIGKANTPSFAITVSPASSTTCTKAGDGPKVTITAMSAANGGGTKLSTYNGTVTLTASSPNVKWYTSPGSLLSGTTVTLTNGSVTLYLADSVAETFTVSAVDATYAYPDVMFGSSGNITFANSTSGLTLTDIDSLSPAYGVVAGRPHAVQATLSACGVTSAVTGSYTGTMYYVPGLNHPAGATAPTINTTASCSGTIGLPLTSAGAAISLDFTAGVSTFYLCTTDVGQYALNATINADKTVNAQSSNFTVRPFVLTASSFLNAASNGPGAGAFVKAGDSFSGTLRAWRWLASADMESPRGDGLPDAVITASTIVNANPGLTPRFGGTTNNAGVVSLAPVVVSPATGTKGILLPATATLSNGSTTLNNFTYSEVGTIGVGGSDGGGKYAVSNYLGAAGLNVPILSVDVGRITPHHFAVTPTGLTARVAASCPVASPFTYMDEYFSFGFKLTAQNAANATTKNYAGSLAFLNPEDLTSWKIFEENSSFGLVAVDDAATPKTQLTSRLTLDSAVDSSGWVGGVNTIEARARVSRNSSVDGPYNSFKIGIAPQDGDGVTANGFNLDADDSGAPERILLNTTPTSIRFGRLRLFNAFGSEKTSLRLPVEAQYWTGKTWLKNTDDSCTAIPAEAIARSKYLDRKGSTASGWTVTPSGFTLSAGRAELVLGPPAPVTTGSVDVCVDLGADPAGGVNCSATSAGRPYLQGRWPPGGSFNNDPSARATFGVYSPETERTVHVRERF